MNIESIKQNWKKWLMRLVIAMVIGASILGGCSYINEKLGLKDDHFVEETTEDQILHHTGVNVDLTPRSPENL